MKAELASDFLVSLTLTVAPKQGLLIQLTSNIKKMNNNNNNKPLQLHIDYGWCGVFVSWRYILNVHLRITRRILSLFIGKYFTKRYYATLTVGRKKKTKGEFADTFIMTDSITAVFVNGGLYRVFISRKRKETDRGYWESWWDSYDLADLRTVMHSS